MRRKLRRERGSLAPEQGAEQAEHGGGGLLQSGPAMAEDSGDGGGGGGGGGVGRAGKGTGASSGKPTKKRV